VHTAFDAGQSSAIGVEYTATDQWESSFTGTNELPWFSCWTPADHRHLIYYLASNPVTLANLW